MRGSIAVAVEIPALSRPAHITPRVRSGGHGTACLSTPHVGWLHLNSRRQHSFQQSGASKACEAPLTSQVGHRHGANSRPSDAAERPLSAAPLSQISLTVVEAASDEELRAAAYLRARTFYTYPDGRSTDGIMTHRRMKAEDDWRALVSKVTGGEESYGRVICLIALAKICSFQLSMTSDLQTCDLQTSCKVGSDSIVVGSLDLNQGLRLPGEISGDRPNGPEAKSQRGYLSNVCVAEEVRRKGVAKALIAHAQNTAQQWGITNLYVHVEFDNLAAKNLYVKSGFEYEREENLPSSRWESRPRRLLLHRSVSRNNIKCEYSAFSSVRWKIAGKANKQLVTGPGLTANRRSRLW